MWKKISLLGIWVLMLSAFACNLNQDKDPIIVPVLEDEFYLDLWQELSPEASVLVVEFTTLQEEECRNAEVLSTYARSNRNLTLTLFDILAPETCLPGPAPAKGQERLPDVGLGTYNLIIELQAIVSNEGVLSVDEQSFQVETATNGFQWQHGRIERMPADALWGYFTYSEETGRAVAEQRLTDLAAFTTTPTWQDGYYGYFELAEDGSFALAERLLPATTNLLPFLVNIDDPTALSAWLEAAEAGLGEGMSLRVFNGIGEEWNY